MNTIEISISLFPQLWIFVLIESNFLTRTTPSRIYLYTVLALRMLDLDWVCYLVLEMHTNTKSSSLYFVIFFQQNIHAWDIILTETIHENSIKRSNTNYTCNFQFYTDTQRVVRKEHQFRNIFFSIFILRKTCGICTPYKLWWRITLFQYKK